MPPGIATLRNGRKDQINMAQLSGCNQSGKARCEVAGRRSDGETCRSVRPVICGVGHKSIVALNDFPVVLHRGLVEENEMREEAEDETENDADCDFHGAFEPPNSYSASVLTPRNFHQRGHLSCEACLSRDIFERSPPRSWPRKAADARQNSSQRKSTVDWPCPGGTIDNSPAFQRGQVSPGRRKSRRDG